MTDVLLTSYFTGRPDPQTGLYIRKNSPDQMFYWVRSAARLHLAGVIFHDEIRTGRADITALMDQAPTISLKRYDFRTPWSVNDERFLCWYEYLAARPKIDRVILCDLFDVEFLRDPFACLTEPGCLYACRGLWPIGENNWLRRKMMATYGRLYHPDQMTANAGVIGGHRDVILRLLAAMTDEFFRLNSSDNVNMQVFNKLVYDIIQPSGRVYLGRPLTGNLKAYEFEGDFCIRHK